MLVKQFFKRLIIKLIDYMLRVVRGRINVVKQLDELRRIQLLQSTAVPPSPFTSLQAGSCNPAMQTLRVRPYVYPADPARSKAQDNPDYFLVTSQGLAGSIWLASSLNLHPDITCSMGIDHPFVSMQYYYNKDLMKARMDAVADQGVIRHGFYLESLRDLFKTRFAEKGIALDTNLARANPVRQLQVMYDELEWFAPAKYFGNVHCCFALQALEYLKEAPTKTDITLANLIRHPIPRTEAAINGILSVATRYKDSDWHRGITEGIDNFTETHPEMRRDIEMRFGVDFTDVRNRGVLYSYYHALHNDCWAGEITMCGNACHVTIERLMSDRDYFSWFVWEITQRKAVAPPEYLDRVFSEEHLQSGRHTGRGRSISPREQYAQWTDWEKHEFKQVMERLKLRDVYAPFGYDLSFVA